MSARFLAVLLCAVPARGQLEVNDADSIIDWPGLPQFIQPLAPIAISPAQIDVWKLALRQPEAEARRLTLHAIQEAHGNGWMGLEVAVPDLETLLDVTDLQPVLRRDAAATLVALDDRKAAPRLLDLIKSDDLDMMLAVDPGLGRWRYLPAFAKGVKRRRLG